MNIFKKTITKILASFFMLAANTGLSLAQVTIGSDIPPVGGALLDLKEDDQAGSNSSKGLLLPLVNLTSLTNLYPMFEGDPDYLENIDNQRTDENASHIGLMVYNTNSCINLYGKDAGVYIWNGSMWQPVSDSKLAPNVSVFVDTRDGQEYRYRSFGDAGVWMLDNMRAQAYDTDFTPAVTLNLIPVSSEPQANSLGNGESRIAYPNYSQDAYNSYPQLGLRYTWVAATGRNSPINITNLNEGDGDSQQLNVGGQGICPNGWHVPSDAEWNKLEQEIYNNAQAYSSYTSSDRNDFNPSAWQTSWNTTETQVSRGSSNSNYGHALAMFNSCILQSDGTIVNNTAIGKSLSAPDGGFNVSLVFGDYAETNKTGLYWTASYFHGGSTGDNQGNAYSRYLYSTNSSQTRKVNPTTKNLFYVRCKQNGT
ncbi:hypothetical protein JGH11_14575 [Dysgonomonas sp. Marseille-P4677]|uniref:FISUMP domain-containing protein n=1 Tax=Dysgonomonas sp. Marseille-P4677 TaxID=2364790 RepID=UPI0019137780|nr:FISUMP domain-containing protein [Dysgonomonas sp. Marseille-P4677]MBK5722100.1 hypothetical protein [Dysgonomonas sp. Marseille-P4677]